MADDLVLGAVEVRDVGQDQGVPTVQLLAVIGDLLGGLPAVRTLAPAPAVHCVPLAVKLDLQLALAPRAGAL